jgi:hypothetical protein
LGKLTGVKKEVVGMERRKFLVLLGLAMLLAWAGGLGQTLWKETFEGLQPPAYDLTKLGWIVTPQTPDVRWRGVDIAQLWGEGLPAFPSGTKAAYFGKVYPDTGKGNYDQGHVGGTLSRENILIDLTKAGLPVPTGQHPPAFVEIRFWSLREVEYYPGGEYDITEAAYTYGSESQTFSHRSSKDKSQRVWEQIVSPPLLVYHQSQSLTIQFLFNSRDGFSNKYLGWLIDDVEVRIAPLRIETEFLPTATVGQTYSVTFEARGGVPFAKTITGPFYVKARVVSGTLPPRFVIPSEWNLNSSAGKYERCVTVPPDEWLPDAPGEYEFTIEIEDALGQKAQKTFKLVVNPKEAISSIFEEHDFSSGWDMTGLWHPVLNSNHIPPQTPSQTPSVAVPTAAYNQGTFPTCHYNTGNRTYGYLTSPEIDVSKYAGSRLRVQFTHWREVEYYDKGKYDLTFVEVSFDGRPWVRIWEKSSADPSEREWITETAEVPIPTDARTVRVRFGFDSVDRYKNDYCGWFVDDVVLTIATGTLEIVKDRLPVGEVGMPYYYKFQATGGVPPYTWEADSRLPDGLSLNRNTGELTGKPTKKADFTFTVTVKDRTGQSVSEDFTLVVEEKTSLFADGFEDGLGNWEGENLGLWHVTKAPPKPNVDLSGRGNVAYYGKDETGNYNTGARTYGYLTSNPFALDGASFFQVTFDYWREVEFYGAGGYDQTYVQVRFLIGTSWSTWYTVWSKDCATPSEKAWTKATIGPYSVPTGATKMQIRFVFDSVDRFYNNYVGWLIDNVKVAKATSGSPLPTSSLTLTAARGEITFQNIPNPVRDVHTTTFVVRGVEAERIRVEVYDLAGKLVWKGEALGNELTWHTEDLTGLPLANGVYLYKVYVKVGEAWIVSDVKKLVILR